MSSSSSSSNSVLDKLPPHVARELRRHISPKPLVSPFAKQQQQQISSSSFLKSRYYQNRYVFIGCTLFTMAAGSMPLILYYWIGGLNDSDEPLTAPQIRRGAYQNSGSKDVGKDPDWNFNNGTHKLQAGYGNHDQKNSTNQSSLPAEYLAMTPNDLNKVHDKIEAFAKGQGKNN